MASTQLLEQHQITQQQYQNSQLVDQLNKSIGGKPSSKAQPSESGRGETWDGGGDGDGGETWDACGSVDEGWRADSWSATGKGKGWGKKGEEELWSWGDATGDSSSSSSSSLGHVAELRKRLVVAHTAIEDALCIVDGGAPPKRQRGERGGKNLQMYESWYGKGKGKDAKAKDDKGKGGNY
jgi:hypothetical protein